MAQLYLFTGENAFQLREERRLWKERFLEKHGDENLLTLPAQGLDFRSLLDSACVAPFIGDKRLIVIDGIPRFEKEQVESLPGMIHPSTIILFCEAKPDKRLGGVKALQKIAETKEFIPLGGGPLIGWVRARAAVLGSPLDVSAAEELVRICGEDQETLARELDKLSTYAAGADVGSQTVRLLAVPSGEQEIWNLSGFLAAGEDAHSVWAILLWMLRSLVAVHAASASGDRNPATIASSAGVPFPTVRNFLPLAGRVTEPGLRRVVGWAADADIALKTGGYRATGEAPQELQA